MIVNVWLAVRGDAYELARIAVEWDEGKSGEPYVGPVSTRETELYSKEADFYGAASSFRQVDEGGFTVFGKTFFADDWYCANLHFQTKTDNPKEVMDEIDWLLTSDPERTYVLGAWDYRTGEVIPGYEPHVDILKFVAPTRIGDGKGGFVDVEPTDLSTANIMLGQTPRSM